MQAWVTSNGLAPNQASPAASGPGPGHDGHGQTNIPQRHVYMPPSTLPAAQQQQQPQTTQTTQNSPPRSRAPIINANSNRAAAVAAARLPIPAVRTSHARDASLNMSRARGIASEPIQPSRRQGPFWDGSTADGSMFSDTASNGDASTAVTSMYRMPFRAPTYQRGETPRPRLPVKQQETHAPPDQHQHPPFIIGANGMIDLVGGPLTRSASTPDTRKQLNRLKGLSSPDPDLDQDSEDGAYHTSPEKTPSAKRLHHTKPLALHTNRRGSFSERATYSNAYPQEENIVSSPKSQAYQNPQNHLDEAQLGRPIHLRVNTKQESQPHRSTIFADTDTPMASHPDESEHESIEPEPTPEPTPKPAAKAKPPISRKLFPKDSKSRVGLDESAMPRPSTEKRPSGSKKRPHEQEQDYDDGVLATMDYAELRNEAFDFDPAQEEAQSVIGPPRGTLPEKLNHFLDKDQASQLEFFTKMPVKDWETSGDWFLQRFGEITQRLGDARRSKRAMVESFENEIADRDDAVRSKIQGIDKTLTEFKREGEGMMVGKEIE
ncbi:extracellular mutant protein 11-domain-containing protein [Hypoxylon rubiginosum]|uniref:Extracellular mutant protein 11-domain-containing protein n=1 Tax=Hypoxylon rubiginosum TaxID=110542 RepID=A0ACB9ZCW8_9PEZI|nr:extracellular mutant protein 11-domain-containing protein [Hypoxylon rubiginosum]